MRKNRNLIRIISLVLAMILCLSLLPLTSMMAGAQEIPEETVEYKEPESEEASSEEESEEESEETSSEAESEETTSEAESEETSEETSEDPLPPAGDHIHTFQVTLNGNTLTVECTVEGCTSKHSLVLEATGKNYNGTKVTATLTGDKAAMEAEKITVGDIKYVKNGKNVTEAKDAGDYEAQCAVIVNGTTYTLKCEFKISKRSFTYENGMEIVTKEFDNSRAAEIINDNAKYSGIVEGDNVKVKFINVQFPNANAREEPYIVDLQEFVLEGAQKDNYVFDYDGSTKTATGKIDPRDISKATVVLGAPLFYNGQKQTQSIKSVSMTTPKLTLKREDYQVSGNTGTAAKNDYELTVTGVGNYCGEVKVTFGIYPNPEKVSGNKYEMGAGTIILEVNNSVSSVSMKSKLANFIRGMSNTDLQKVANGEIAEWIWQVDIVEALYISDSQKKELKTEAGTYTIYGKYISIEVFTKKDGVSEKQYETPFELQFSMKVPSKVPALKSGQKLLVKIVRGHTTAAGKYERKSLEATLSEDKKSVTFGSNKFSEFAFASKPSSSVATGDERPVGLVAVVLAVAVCTLGGLLYWENKARKSV